MADEREATKKKAAYTAETAKRTVDQGMKLALKALVDCQHGVERHRDMVPCATRDAWLEQAKDKMEEAIRRRAEIQASRSVWETAVIESCLPEDDQNKALDAIEGSFQQFLGSYNRSKIMPSEYLRKIEENLTQTKHLKVENLKCPNFGGNIEEFLLFKSSFQGIYERAQMPDHARLSHLRSHLKGEAFQAISTIGTEDEDYATAWTVLDARYGDRTILKRQLYHDLAYGQGAKSNDPFMIRKAHDFVRTKYTKLVQVEPKIAQQGEAMMPLIDRYYPSSLLREVEKDLDGKEPTVQEFFEAAEAIITRDLRIANEKTFNRAPLGNNGAGQGAGGGQRSNSRNFNSGGTTAGLMAGTGPGKPTGGKPKPKNPGFKAPVGGGGQGGPNSKGNTKKCALCKAVGHYVTGCPTYMKLQVQQREDKIRELNLCFRCLRDGHRGQDCQFARTCSVKEGGSACGMKTHHYTLHKPKQVKFANGQ